MLSTDTIRNIVGVIGNVISFGLFLSPVPTFYKIFKNKAVGDFSPIPYLATLLNCMLWVFYGIPLVQPHSKLVVTINGIGLLLEAAYLAIFIAFALRSDRCRVLKIMLAEVVSMAGVVTGVLAGAHTHETRSLVVGVMCVVVGTCMYASPLAAMRHVVRTRSVEYMPLPLSVASFLNGVCWTVYALLKFDIFITIPNGLGALLGALQLVLYSYYYFMAPKGEPKSELQLPTVVPKVASAGEGKLSAISIQ